MAVDFEIIDNNELQFGVGASDELEFGTRDIIEIRQSGDYEDLTNKPSINGVTLIGDKTTEDLHIQAGVIDFHAVSLKLQGKVRDVEDAGIGLQAVPYETFRCGHDIFRGGIVGDDRVNNLAAVLVVIDKAMEPRCNQGFKNRLLHRGQPVNLAHDTASS